MLHGVTAVAVVLFLVWTAACGFSVTAGYHRLFTHGAYRAHAALRAFWLFFGAAAIENSALKWCSDHRRHHASVDEEADPYNIRLGFWWAHIAWIFFRDDQRIEKVGDLERDPLVRLQHRFYVPLLLFASFGLPTWIGLCFGDAWGGLVLGGFLRLVVLYHATFCVNSLAHMFGGQPYSDGDSSRDSSLTALITLGEGYHNFHHTFPFDYRNGVRAWHFDPTKWVIRGLSWTGLAGGLVRAPHDAILKARIRMDEKRVAGWVAEHPVLAVRLREARERLEKLAERWAELKAQMTALRERTGRASREALDELRSEMREARRRFREAYGAWRLVLRQPELLAA